MIKKYGGKYQEKAGAIVKTTEMHDKIEKYLSAGLTYDYSTSHD